MKRLLLAVWICSLSAAAYATDFDPHSAEWNGLGLLQKDIPQRADLQMQTISALDWAQVDEHDVLLVFAPQVAPQGAALDSLTRFVDAGGRLIVADDFAQGAAWLAPFGVKLVAEPARALQHYENVDGLPMVSIAPLILMS